MGPAGLTRRGRHGERTKAAYLLKLVDITAESGVTFQHVSGAAGDKHLPETMGGGIAWLDYDGDGWQDLYLVQSGSISTRRRSTGRQSALS